MSFGDKRELSVLVSVASEFSENMKGLACFSLLVLLFSGIIHEYNAGLKYFYSNISQPWTGDLRKRTPKLRPAVTPILVGMTELMAVGSVTDSSKPRISRDDFYLKCWKTKWTVQELWHWLLHWRDELVQRHGVLLLQQGIPGGAPEPGGAGQDSGVHHGGRRGNPRAHGLLARRQRCSQGGQLRLPEWSADDLDQLDGRRAERQRAGQGGLRGHRQSQGLQVDDPQLYG